MAVVPDLCAMDQSAHLTCPYAGTFYSASVIWYAALARPLDLAAPTDLSLLAARRGLIGPARQFNEGKYYNGILFYMLAGAVLPVISWLLAKRYPSTWVQYINVPVALTGLIVIPPATGINLSSWFIVGFIFRASRRSLPWHRLPRRRADEPHVILQSTSCVVGISGGGASTTSSCRPASTRAPSSRRSSSSSRCSCPRAARSVRPSPPDSCPASRSQLMPVRPLYVAAFNWWGNTVFTETADWAGTPFKTAPPEGFGPTTW